MQHRWYIGFEYWDGKGTTIGEPNRGPGQFHGRLSIAGYTTVFERRKLRDAWVEQAPPGVLREAVSKRTLRRLKSGKTLGEFRDFWDWIIEEKTIKGEGNE